MEAMHGWVMGNLVQVKQFHFCRRLKAALMLINPPPSFLSPNFSLLEALPSFQLISTVYVCQDTSCSTHGIRVKSCFS